MPTINVAPYRKLVAAIIGGLVIIGTAIGEAIADGALDYGDGILIAGAIGTALGVYQATNTPADEASAE